MCRIGHLCPEYRQCVSKTEEDAINSTKNQLSWSDEMQETGAYVKLTEVMQRRRTDTRLYLWPWMMAVHCVEANNC